MLPATLLLNRKIGNSLKSNKWGMVSKVVVGQIDETLNRW